MNGIPIRSGVNDCYHNVDGYCVCKEIYFNAAAGRSRWDSRVKCSLTQFGVHLCHHYLQAGRVA